MLIVVDKLYSTYRHRFGVVINCPNRSGRHNIACAIDRAGCSTHFQSDVKLFLFHCQLWH
nr:MAG TPA: hypothetical protein [Caudoviricetes sp.]